MTDLKRALDAKEFMEQALEAMNVAITMQPENLAAAAEDVIQTYYTFMVWHVNEHIDCLKDG